MLGGSGKAHTAFEVDSSDSLSILLFTLKGLTVRLSVRERQDSEGEKKSVFSGHA